MAYEEQKLDLGSISHTFGLKPYTLQLNGYFITCGLDLIASSVTWRSLLSFFSSMGLSTGKDDKDALVVDGKLLNIGNRRGEEYSDSMNGGFCCGRRDGEECDANRQKKMKKGSEREHPSPPGGCRSDSLGVGLKRKQLLEVLKLLRKLKIDDGASSSNSEKTSKDLSRSGHASSVLQFTCRYLNDNLKRVREEEVVEAPCKRTR